MQLTVILDSQPYKEALTTFLTNNGGIEKLELLNASNEFQKIPTNQSATMRQRAGAIFGKHRVQMNPETQQIIAAQLGTRSGF